ncbi:MAG: response regulator [Proteobacteria bacterium]|nr:response regulator [Pseudomonadota bacterium]
MRPLTNTASTNSARWRGDDENRAASEHANRILIIDDNPSIHADFREILANESASGLDALDDFFSDAQDSVPQPISFEIDSAYQGQEGLAMVEQAMSDGRPYAVCFLDIRMPPGWNGPETLSHLWRVSPDLQVVLCTAFSDFSWQELLVRFDRTDRLLILKKPFEVLEVRQLAHALSEKWRLARQDAERMATLERRVAERTRELDEANKQLRREMQERIRAQNELNKRHRLEALGRLAAGIGHEINNPLNFVLGNVELAREMIDDLKGQIPGEEREELTVSLDAALVGTQRIAQIVRSINHFVRPGQVVEEPVSVVPAVKLAISMVESDLADHIELDTELSEVPPVLGRRVELEQVFVNLLKNAIHSLSSPSRSEARIRVITRCNDSDVIVTVADTGTGIDKVHLDKIFDPFFTTKPVGQGTGLGLSVCHAIVIAMGGHIEVSSGQRGGTVVTVRLPALSATPSSKVRTLRVKNSADNPSGDTSPIDWDSGLGEHKQNGRILVVDDEPLIQAVIRRALPDHEVVCVDNGRTALAHCLQEDWDAIFCDIMMAEFTGMDLYKTLENTRPDILDTIVFITGGTFLEEVHEFLSNVPNECLEKPISNTRIRRQVAELLSQKPTDS